MRREWPRRHNAVNGATAPTRAVRRSVAVLERDAAVDGAAVGLAVERDVTLDVGDVVDGRVLALDPEQRAVADLVAAQVDAATEHEHVAAARRGLRDPHAQAVRRLELDADEVPALAGTAR